ncbi:aminotransferase class I/II-fold pyridoxal phosphate-dependent enzyme [Paludifilum halophilum]|uniref:Aminotransferase n=1 Tax=Paludifilum halophilum TaxID=1642702 RepID=A0A235B3K7_9BACL|nr:aminotransferase class I/II-fold pyridoxal phosphate-dependent enzyme [Paludifilum halophilum]OYD06853.1 aminotransferase [Paludifilum halophilum]
MKPSILDDMTIDQAKELQFRLVSAIAREFSGHEFFRQGDVGVVPATGRPVQTAKVEQVLAHLFQSQACALARGAGTGAIRSLLSALLEPGDSLIVHTAPVYTTTRETFRMMGLKFRTVDFNDSDSLHRFLQEDRRSRLFYVQHSRQQPNDTYDLKTTIGMVRRVRPDLPVVVDDNYTACKVPHIGVELGASYSCFSGFKLLGPPGIGIVVGNEEAVKTIRRRNYSGGGQVQGYEAMELLRSLVTAPVAIAVQTEQVNRLHRMLNSGRISGIKQAVITHSQSKNVIVELDRPIAPEVIKASEKYGAAVYPVGAESRFEILPMIYRVSGTFLETRPELAKTGIRINPMRAGADLTLEILKRAIADETGERG